MRKHIIISAAAMLAAGTAAYAQNPGKGEGANAPSASGPGNAGGNADMPRGNSGNAPSARDSAPGQMKGDGNSARDNAPGQTKGDRESARDEAPGQKKDSNASTDDGKSGQKQNRADDADGLKKNGANNGASEGTSGKSGSVDKSQGKNIAEIPQEKKSQVRSAFSKHRVEPAKGLNISVNVGVAVPRSVRLYSVPQDIIVIYPAYSSYRYFVIDDRICIVDPDTYEIVEVIVIA